MMRRAILPLFFCLAFSQSAAAQTTEYQSCLGLLDTDAAQALRVAEEWRNAGGGLPARHCRALALAQIGDFAAAALEAEALAGEAPESALKVDLLTQAAEFKLAVSDTFAARGLFDRALAIEPDAIEALEGRARTAAAQRDFSAAITDLTRLLWIAPGDAEALSLRAAARRQTGDKAGALSDAEAAVAADPLSAVARFERGAARAVSGDVTGARADWDEAERLDPEGEIGPLVRANRGRLPQ